MNFSNLIFEKPFETESSLSLVSKKNGTSPFLFADIIKVCEQEKSPQTNTELKPTQEPPLEIFSSAENVVKVTKEEYAELNNFISELIAKQTDIQPTETIHKIDDTEITKLRLIVPEEKLVELTTELINKTGLALVPLNDNTELTEKEKPLTVTYKTQSNKITVGVTPLKVDEQYNKKAIEDEYNFVNKIIVDEGLINLFAREQVHVVEEKDKTNLGDELVNTKDVGKNSTAKEEFTSDKVFYKVEILKIEFPELENPVVTNFSFATTTENLESRQTNSPVQSSLKLVDKISEVGNPFESILASKELKAFAKMKYELPMQTSNLENEIGSSTNKQLNSSENITNISSASNENVGFVKSLEKQKVDIALSTSAETKPNVANTSETKTTAQNFPEIKTAAQHDSEIKSQPSLNYLLEDLTDEEKTVFKSSITSGDLKRLVFTKEQFPFETADGFQKEVNDVKKQAAININSVEVDTTTLKTTVKELVDKENPNKTNSFSNVKTKQVGVIPNQDNVDQTKIELASETLIEQELPSKQIIGKTELVNSTQTKTTKNSFEVRKDVRVDEVTVENNNQKISTNNKSDNSSDVVSKETKAAQKENFTESFKSDSKLFTKATSNSNDVIKENLTRGFEKQLSTENITNVKQNEIEAKQEPQTVIAENKKEKTTQNENTSLEFISTSKLFSKVSSNASNFNGEQVSNELDKKVKSGIVADLTTNKTETKQELQTDNTKSINLNQKITGKNIEEFYNVKYDEITNTPEKVFFETTNKEKPVINNITEATTNIGNKKETITQNGFTTEEFIKKPYLFTKASSNTIEASKNNLNKEFDNELGTEKVTNIKPNETKATQDSKTVIAGNKEETASQNGITTEEFISNAKLFVKVTNKQTIKVDVKVKHETVEQDISKDFVAQKPIEKEEFQKPELVKSEKAKEANHKSDLFAKEFVFVSESKAEIKRESASQAKPEISTKEQNEIQIKETKLPQENLNQQSDKESGKQNSSEAFKSHLNAAASTEKTIFTDITKPQAEAKHATELFKTVKQQEIMPEFSKLILQGEKQTLTLQLTPENLGKVKLTVDMVENQLVTKIEVENEQVRQFVQQNVDQLKQNMQQAGIALANVNVSLSDEQRNQKVFNQKKKSSSREGKEEAVEEVKNDYEKKQMGYNTYEFTA